MKSFKRYLKRRGKKDSVVERNIRIVESFHSYNSSQVGSDISSGDVQRYVEKIESEGKSAKGFLYVMMNYFRHTENEEMYAFAARLREERTSKTRRKFKLNKFLGIDTGVVEKLRSIGIIDVEQMLDQGRTREQRAQLASTLQIPEGTILELVNLSDLTRMGYVKRKLSRLYYDAGLCSPAQVSEYEPDALHEHFRSYVERSGWDGMVPNRKDLKNNIKNARKLAEVVEY